MYLRNLIFFITLFPLIAGVSAQESDTATTVVAIPEFELPDTNYTNSGSIKLIWTIPDSTSLKDKYSYELQRSSDSAFDSSIVRYAGPDLACYVSGLRNGLHQYRVRSILNGDTSLWSRTVVVSVEHHSLKLAFILFGLGAVVFIATVVVVVGGTRNQSSIDSSENPKQGG